MPSYYINTDLVLESKQDLSALAECFRKNAELLYAEPENGIWHVSAEARGSGLVDHPKRSPQRDIASLLKLLESLSRKNRELLSKCSTFDLNVGWQSSDKRPEGCFSLPTETLARMCRLGASLTVTIYPSSETDSDEWTKAAGRRRKGKPKAKRAAKKARWKAGA